MQGKTNIGGGDVTVKSLNKSLLIWLPLDEDINNYGKLKDVQFAQGHYYLRKQFGGVLYPNCYYNPGVGYGGLISNKAVNIGQKQSLFAWVKFDALGSASSLGGSAGGQHRADSNSGLGLNIRYVSGSTGYVTVSTGNGSSRTYNTYYGKTLLTAGAWYHLGYTYDGNVIKLYVNGQLDGTHTVGAQSTPADYVTVFAWTLSGTSGAFAANANYHLNGYINDFRYYNCVVTDEQALAIYNWKPKDYGKVRTKPIRYIRLGLKGSTANTGNHWCELQAFTEDGVNVALNKTVTGVVGSGFTSLSLVTDGNLNANSYAYSADGLAKIQIDLGAVYNIQRINKRNYNGDTRVYYYNTTEISTDGSTWETIFDSEVKNQRYYEMPNGYDTNV